MLRPGRVPHQLRGREEGDAVPPRGPLRGDAGPLGGGTCGEDEERDSSACDRRGPRAGREQPGLALRRIDGRVTPGGGGPPPLPAVEKHSGELARSQASSHLMFRKIKERLARERKIVL